jgi:hypothetical protein
MLVHFQLLFNSNNFVDQFFVFVSKAPSALVKKGSSTNNLWHDGNKMALAATVPKIYSQRIKDLYKSHAPDKVSGVSDLMKKSKGKEHELYLRICNKYGTDPEEEYLEPSVSDKPLWKYTAGEEVGSPCSSPCDLLIQLRSLG